MTHSQRQKKKKNVGWPKDPVGHRKAYYKGRPGFVKDQLKGGKADNKPDRMFKKSQLKAGQKIEMEHTNKQSISKEITKDHLIETDKDPRPNKINSDYYDKKKGLPMMEKSLKKDREQKTMRLQGIGLVNAESASNAKVGDKLVWNYGGKEEILNIKESESRKTAVYTVKTDTGRIAKRRMTKTRLVVISRK